MPENQRNAAITGTITLSVKNQKNANQCNISQNPFQQRRSSLRLPQISEMSSNQASTWIYKSIV
jgi:hypothetical protein